ncbi:MAG TPA: hypothetical protein VK966_09830 [Longimicrobiales bacterium]|nr:hypothetical protein [Longimicrobiales bacterium]
MQATSPELIDQLQTIMWAQVVMAAVMVLCALAIIGAGVAVLLLVRRAGRALEETRDQVLPHVTPVLSRAGTIADDVREITAGLREDADAVHETVRDVLRRSHDAADSLEERVRRFGAVMEVVQEEAQSLLMDAAATASGVTAAARALREEGTDAPRRSAAHREFQTKDGHDEERPIG